MNFKIWLEQQSKENVYWGGIDLVSSKEGILKVHLVNGKILKVAENSPVTKLNSAPKDTLFQPPWVKYFKYDDKDQILYAENRVVDIVLISEKYNAVYLIDRKSKPQGLEIPGGFIDEDEIKKHNNPSENIENTAARDAAARELQEETNLKVDPSELKFINRFPMQGSDNRETIVTTFAFKYYVKDESEMKSLRASDDAGQAAGSDDMKAKGFYGWYNLNTLNSLSFAFPEHKQIILSAIK